MQNEERIAVLETQLRTLKKIMIAGFSFLIVGAIATIYFINTPFQVQLHRSTVEVRQGGYDAFEIEVAQGNLNVELDSDRIQIAGPVEIKNETWSTFKDGEYTNHIGRIQQSVRIDNYRLPVSIDGDVPVYVTGDVSVKPAGGSFGSFKISQ